MSATLPPRNPAIVVACASALVGSLALAALVHADVARSPWAAFKQPAGKPPRSIGEYSTGCLQGGVALPLDGEGFQVMHPSRLRYYGHPDLIDFIQTLGKGLTSEGFSPVLVGDLSQPRGGPAPGGHSSHQTGLDVDLWFWHPGKRVTNPQRETLKARSILDGKNKTIQAREATRVAALLRLTARDPRVTRIFVHPIIKRQLCQDVTGERDWLQKVRPWYGHDDHLHVRLACPPDSAGCVAQAAVPAGDGCGADLDYWFDEQAQKDREDGRKSYQSRVGKAPRMPAECFELISQK